MKKVFYSNGKLLLTGEYLVLDGALSLAIPTQFGQSLSIETIEEPKLIWKSISDKGEVWFKDEFLIEGHKIMKQSQKFSEQDDNIVADRLLQILNASKRLNSSLFRSEFGYKVTTKLDFSRNWGLGTSSTLINNIAQWAKIDAYKLLEQTFGGSGYDIACTQHYVPITYQLKKSNRHINEIDFNPEFKNNLYFVHLNKKQNSRKGIVQYNENKDNSILAISEISDITSKIIKCTSIDVFETLIISHEHIISKIIKQQPIKELLFGDYKGAIKSLGAWGGDFILVTGNEDSFTYFKNKGFQTVVPYTEMILK